MHYAPFTNPTCRHSWLCGVCFVSAPWIAAPAPWIATGSQHRCLRLLGFPLCTHPQVLLLDEITVDLDVVGRLQLLDFFRAECEERGATILYATHIFDGLESWITHLAYLEDGKIVHGEGGGGFGEAAGEAVRQAASVACSCHALLAAIRAVLVGSVTFFHVPRASRRRWPSGSSAGHASGGAGTD